MYTMKRTISIYKCIQLYLGHMLNLWSDVILQVQPNDLQAFPSNHINGSLNTCVPTDTYLPPTNFKQLLENYFGPQPPPK